MTDVGPPNGSKETFTPLMAKAFYIASRISPFTKSRFNRILQDLPLSDGKRVLDVGCGPGNLILLIAKRFPGTELAGIDPSPEMVNVSRKRISGLESHGKVTIAPGSCLNVPLTGKFDIIVTTSSYHHWEDQHGGLEHLAELLKDDGILAVYERYYGEKSDGRSSKATHSLSREEAESMFIEGYSKTVSMVGKLISVKFKRQKV